MVTAESDLERFTVFLADDRAALHMMLEDGGWQDRGRWLEAWRVAWW